MPHRTLTLALACALSLAVPALAQQGGRDPSFNLVNRGASAVRELFVTPSGDPNWGRERLHGAAIAPGGVLPVRRRINGGCRLDIKVVFADKRTEQRRNLDTCTLDAVTVGGPERPETKAADDPSFRLVNRGAVDLREFYVTPSGIPNWGRNRLAGSGLPAGTATVIHMARTSQCDYDLRAVFADHKALEQRHEDLCRITDVPVP